MNAATFGNAVTLAFSGFTVGACVDAFRRNSTDRSQIASGILMASIYTVAAISLNTLAAAYGAVETGLILGAAAGAVFSIVSPGKMSVAKVVSCIFVGEMSLGVAVAVGKDLFI